MLQVLEAISLKLGIHATDAEVAALKEPIHPEQLAKQIEARTAAREGKK